jgi:hypothetical protein
MANGLIRNTIHNCKQATLLHIKKQEKKISPAERVKLFIHLLFCDPCRLFVKQAAIIDQSLRQLQSGQPAHTLPEASRKKIQQLLDQEK